MPYEPSDVAIFPSIRNEFLHWETCRKLSSNCAKNFIRNLIWNTRLIFSIKIIHNSQKRGSIMPLLSSAVLLTKSRSSWSTTTHKTNGINTTWKWNNEKDTRWWRRRDATIRTWWMSVLYLPNWRRDGARHEIAMLRFMLQMRCRSD